MMRLPVHDRHQGEEVEPHPAAMVVIVLLQMPDLLPHVEGPHGVVGVAPMLVVEMHLIQRLVEGRLEMRVERMEEMDRRRPVLEAGMEVESARRPLIWHA